MTAYEGEYALPNMHGTSTKLGIKLKGFDDPIVALANKFIKGDNNPLILKVEEYLMWKKYDTKGLAEWLKSIKSLIEIGEVDPKVLEEINTKK